MPAADRRLTALHDDTPLLIRTDFEHEPEWVSVQVGLSTPREDDRFPAMVEIVDDPDFRDMDAAELRALFPATDRSYFFVVADTAALTEPGHPLLAVPLLDADPDDPDEQDEEFRVAAHALGVVQMNFSIGNLSWHDFADNLMTDGVFRGFSPSP